MSNKIEVHVEGFTDVVGDEELGLVILSNEENNRQISLPCDQEMLKEFAHRMRHEEGNDRRLPEVLGKILQRDTLGHYEVVINALKDGKYTALIVNEDSLDLAPVRATDAVLFAYVSHFKIFVEETLWLHQSAPFSEQDSRSGRLGIPINVLSDDLLQKALADAIHREDYEAASHIRDEINKRKQNKAEKP